MFPLVGNAFLKALARKIPDKEFYDVGEEVNLICTLDNSSGKVEPNDWETNYAFRWYKLFSDGSQERISSKRSHSLGKLTPQSEGRYKCEVKRSYENYELVIKYNSFQFVNIKFKGKIIIMH